MGKEGELWDDSALVKALDYAVAKYKTMHGETCGDNLIREEEEEEEEEEQKFMNGGGENGQNPTENVIEPCVSSYNTGATNELPPVQTNQLGEGSSAPDTKKHSESGPVVQETFGGGYMEVKYAEYNQLLSQYYDLEEQMRKVSDQLNQKYYEGSSSHHSWNVSHPMSQPQLPAYHAPYSYCPMCPCQCLAASCASMPTCPMGGLCFSENGTQAAATACRVDLMGPSSCSDDTIVKAAKEAAERAVSSIKLDTSMMSSTCEENTTERKGSSDTSCGGTAQNSGSKTDLAAVLNAWFSAGFYTGKYLLEQSLPKNRQ